MLDLTTNPNLVLRLFITLFNLQGARRSAKLVYITILFSLCQELFSDFFDLFSFFHPRRSDFVTQACQPGRRSRKRLAYITTHPTTCQHPFSGFSKLITMCMFCISPIQPYNRERFTRNTNSSEYTNVSGTVCCSHYRTLNCQNATALAAATLRESTPWDMGIRTV